MTTAIASVTAIDIAKFVQSIGVNTHLGNWTVYENVGLVESSLAYLGVTTVRDGSMFSTAHAQAAYSQLATDGIKFDFFTPTGTDLSTFINQLDAFVAAHPGSLFAIEGPNEVDLQAISYNGSSSLTSAAAFQRALFAAVQVDPNLKDVPVYNLTLSQPNTSNYNQVGNLASATDDANIHAYVWSGTTPNQALLNDMNIARWDAAGLPVIFTETGYDTMTSDPMSGVDQTVQAKYTLDTLMDAFKNGVAQTFLYELFDEASDPNFTNNQAHFGLFNNDGSPKLVATAIHNLTTILSDPNASRSFTPGSLPYGLDNMPSTASQLLLEKHDGTFDLVLWDEHVIWDPTQQKEIASPTSDVTLNLGKSYAVVYVFDPLVGTSPIATYTNVSQIHVSLTDHPLVIQIGSGSLTSSAPSSAGALADTTPPDAPNIASFSPDAGLVGDGITNASRLTLTGTAEAGSKILVFDGTTQIGTTAVDGSGNWAFATGTLADGIHGFTGRAVDGAGNVSAASSAFSVTIDTVAPNAPVLGSDTLISSNKVVVSGTAEAGSTIKLYEADTLLGTAVTASNGTWSLTTGSLANGTHAFTATASDAAGNVSNLATALPTLVGTIIDATGSAGLIEIGNKFYVGNASTGFNAELKVAGVAEVADPTGHVAPLGAEKTATGYQVVWTLGGGRYSIWTADNNGNETSYVHVSGTSSTLETLETTFHEDLNGDGVIGAAPVPTTLIETKGSAGVAQIAGNFYVGNASTGYSTELKVAGVAQVADPTGQVAPLAAEKTATGYQVVWTLGGGLYSIWTTDNNGNEIAYVHVSGTSSMLKALEATFLQDFNGDGVINTASTVLDVSGKAVLALSNTSQAATIEPGAMLELTGAASGAIRFAGTTGTLVLDHASQFTGTISGLSGNGSAASSDILDLKDISFVTGTRASYSGNTAGGILTVSDAQNHISHITLVGDYTHSTFNLSSDGRGGTFVIDPPADGFVFAAVTSQTGPKLAAATRADDLVPHLSGPAGALYDPHFAPNVQGGEGAHLTSFHTPPVEGFLLHI
ncbi:Ig-like domain-containing protein [Bradyrhizobium sp. LTSPM299]|uniref:Ig-like domain-containing protein n=1 Tax=Bradyrhizobium sp. LTSPM299 TaxID=1619233 RepID=UPI0006790AE8|nr:Ig-like domain-containing protein [Bradyrhizobium sp. LTSPM299]